VWLCVLCAPVVKTGVVGSIDNNLTDLARDVLFRYESAEFINNINSGDAYN